jgi:hypothetical protein
VAAELSCFATRVTDLLYSVRWRKASGRASRSAPGDRNRRDGLLRSFSCIHTDESGRAIGTALLLLLLTCLSGCFSLFSCLMIVRFGHGGAGPVGKSGPRQARARGGRALTNRRAAAVRRFQHTLVQRESEAISWSGHLCLLGISLARRNSDSIKADDEHSHALLRLK